MLTTMILSQSLLTMFSRKPATDIFLLNIKIAFEEAWLSASNGLEKVQPFFPSLMHPPDSESSSPSGPGWYHSLGCKPNEVVVAKCFYFALANSDVVQNNSTSLVPKEAKIKHYSFVDEQKKVEAEANLLYWADSLMLFANSWVQAQISQCTNNGDPCYKFHLWNSFLYEMVIWQGPSWYQRW